MPTGLPTFLRSCPALSLCGCLQRHGSLSLSSLFPPTAMIYSFPTLWFFSQTLISPLQTSLLILVFINKTKNPQKGVPDSPVSCCVQRGIPWSFHDNSDDPISLSSNFFGVSHSLLQIYHIVNTSSNLRNESSWLIVWEFSVHGQLLWSMFLGLHHG